MEFPIQDLLSKEESEKWILEYFCPEGLKCLQCGAPVAEAYLSICPNRLEQMARPKLDQAPH